jgi:hypothetical protein
MPRSRRPIGVPEERTPAAPLPKRGMVRWFDPRQLLRTGFDAFFSAVLGQRFDYRTLEDVGPEQHVFDYRSERDELWFDYMADTGDGWESTYAMLSLVAQPFLALDDYPLTRGAFLLLGGDEVYPVASKATYRERLVGPLKAALPRGDAPDQAPGPDLFAIPGNHDWYDGLVSFSRLFTQRRTLGAWQTCQRRSYFAIRLPGRWWLWAIDTQLESDIDLGQLEYFRGVATSEGGLAAGDRVILATAEPDWLYRDIKDPVAESNLAFLEDKIIKRCGAEVHVWLAGDVHHYRRHEHTRDPGYQRITSGGGGAYLSPTHAPLFGAAGTMLKRTVRVGTERFHQQFAYPTPATSFRLSFLNLLFLVKNWTFGLVTGLVYATLTWGPEQGGSLAEAAKAGLAEHPARLLWILAVLAGFIFYADSEFPLFRWVGGIVHGLAHLTAAFAIADATAHLCADMGAHTGVLAVLCRLGGNFVAGAVVGPMIVGLYLMLASNLFGAHADQAFAALRIRNFKHFLRFHVSAGGQLRIYPIAVPVVPGRTGASAQYMLLEGPIKIA